jgi:hypothetical protein
VPEADHRQKLNNAAKVTIWEGVDPQGMREIQGIQAFDRGNHQGYRRQCIVIGPQNFRLLDASSYSSSCYIVLRFPRERPTVWQLTFLYFVFVFHPSSCVHQSKCNARERLTQRYLLLAAARCQSLRTSESRSSRRSPPIANLLMLRNEDDLSATPAKERLCTPRVAAESLAQQIQSEPFAQMVQSSPKRFSAS